MSAALWWPWATLVLLGAAHGINPGMGWLFAVALGLQDGSRRAVWRALLPLALGHTAAIALAAGLALVAGLMLPLRVIEWVVALVLVSVGVRMLVGHRHRRWGGMRVGFRDLTVWSFLMASAHGAGLMAVPVLMRAMEPVRSTSAWDDGPGSAGSAFADDHLIAVAATQPAIGISHGAETHTARTTHRAHLPSGSGAAGGVSERTLATLGTLVHSVGYLVVTAVVAVVVFERLGLRFLRSAWINLDAIWGVALIVTGVAAVAF